MTHQQYQSPIDEIGSLWYNLYLKVKICCSLSWKKPRQLGGRRQKFDSFVGEQEFLNINTSENVNVRQ